jgi:hypothetical protein
MISGVDPGLEGVLGVVPPVALHLKLGGFSWSLI